jgi:hypothetical protein
MLHLRRSINHQSGVRVASGRLRRQGDAQDGVLQWELYVVAKQAWVMKKEVLGDE